MLPEQVGKGFVGQFLKGPHPVACKLGELVERVVVEGNQFAQNAINSSRRADAHAMIDHGNCSGQEQGQGAAVDFGRRFP